MPMKIAQFVNKTTALLSSACTFTSLGVHENVKLQATTIEKRSGGSAPPELEVMNRSRPCIMIDGMDI